MLAPAVLGQERVERLDGRGEKAAPERRVRHEADAELAAGRQDLALDIAAPQRVLGLDAGDGMHLAGAPDRRRAGLRELQVAHLALLDEPFHGPDRVLDRHRPVHAVHAVDVDHVHAEPLQAPSHACGT